VSTKQSKYTPEFRRDAVQLARSSDQPTAQTARDLGIAEATLYSWVSQAKIDDGQKEGLTSDERTELAQLKRDYRRVKMERDFLKKAAAFFARDSETP